MRNFFIPLLIISSLLFLGFGLAMMPQMNAQNHSQCPFETAGIANCAQAQNLVDFMSAHANAFSQFFSAGLAPGFSFSLALFLLFVLALVAILSKNLLPAPNEMRKRIRKRAAFIPQNNIQFVHWLSLHENSPALIARRA